MEYQNISMLNSGPQMRARSIKVVQVYKCIIVCIEKVVLLGGALIISIRPVQDVIYEVSRMSRVCSCRISARRLVIIRVPRGHLLVPLEQLRHVLFRLQMTIEV